jgi:putative NADPH-quinone reductase
MGKHILLIQGHPDAGKQHSCHALEESYVRGAIAAGHEVIIIWGRSPTNFLKWWN